MRITRRALVMLASAAIGVTSFAPQAAAGSRWVAYCRSQEGTPTTEPDGIAHCWVDGVDIFAKP